MSKIKSRIGHRPQKAVWGTMSILEALGKAPGGGTPCQSGLRAGVAILEINLLTKRYCQLSQQVFSSINTCVFMVMLAFPAFMFI